MPNYFLQNDGDTILDDTGAVFGKKSQLEAQGYSIGSMPDPVAAAAPTTIIPENSQTGLVARAGNSLRDAVSSVVPELNPYTTSPVPPPQNTGQAYERTIFGDMRGQGADGGVGSQDVYSRAANRVAGDVMALDNYFERNNDLSPKRVAGLLAGKIPYGFSTTLDIARRVSDVPWKEAADSFNTPNGLSPFLGQKFSEGIDQISSANAGTELALNQGYDVQGGVESFTRPRLPGDADPASAAFLDAQAGQLYQTKRKELMAGGMPQMQAEKAAAQAAFEDAQTRKSAAYMETIKSKAPEPTEPGSVGASAQFLGDVVSNTPRMLGTAAASIVGSPALGAAAMGQQIFGDSYAKYAQEGKDPKRAMVAAGVNAVIQGSMEYLPMDALVKTLGAAGKKLPHVLATAKAEGLTEYLQDYPEAFADVYVDNPGASPAQLFKLFAEKVSTTEFQKSAAYDGAVGAALGLGIAGGGVGVQKAAQGVQKGLGKLADSHSPSVVAAPDFIAKAASTVGVDPTYLTNVMMAESGGKNIKATTSSASGLFQFTDGTWSGLVKQYGQEYGLTPDGRSDPNQQATAAALLTKDNADSLRQTLGREPSSGDLYMAHFLGSAGSAQFLAGLSQDPNAPAIRYASPAAVKANESIFINKDTKQPRSAQEVYDLMTAKVSGSGATQAVVAQPGQQAQVTSQPGLTAEEETVAPKRPWETTIPGEEETAATPGLEQQIGGLLDSIGGEVTQEQTGVDSASISDMNGEQEQTGVPSGRESVQGNDGQSGLFQGVGGPTPGGVNLSQAGAGGNVGVGQTSSQDQGQSQAAGVGRQTVVAVPNRGKLPVQFEVVERDSIAPSHLPSSDFQKNPNYTLENERRYHAEPAQRAKVLENSQNLDSHHLMDAPDANMGAPIVDHEGNVLGVNGRAMSINHAYDRVPERAAAYRTDIAARAAEFGISPAVVAGMREPVLIRRVVGQHDVATRQSLVADLNEGFTYAKDKRAGGKSRGDRISRGTLEALSRGLRESETLRKYFDESGSTEVVEMLIRDGVIQKSEGSALIGPDGLLNPDGKNIVEQALRGRIADNYEVLASLPGDILGKIDAIIPHILSAESFGEAWSITPQVKEAVALLSEYKRSGIKDVTNFLSQIPLSGGVTAGERTSALAQAIFRMTLDSKKAILVEAFAKYSNAAKVDSMPMNMGMGVSPDTASKASFGAVKQSTEQNVSQEQFSTANSDGTLRADGEAMYRKKDAATAGAPDDKLEDAARQWQEKGTESPYFKAWVGDANFVGPVIHGSPSGKISEFKTRNGIAGFFTTKDTSGSELANHFSGKDQGASTYPVYLKFNRLFDPSRADHLSMLNENIPSGAAKVRGAADWVALENKDVVSTLKRLGFDAMKVKEGYEGGPDNIAVFSPEQIKSAIGNRGTFSPDDASILKRQGKPNNGIPAAAVREALASTPYRGAEVLNHPGELDDPRLFEQLRRTGNLGARGTYNPRTGRAYVFANNHDDLADALQTARDELHHQATFRWAEQQAKDNPKAGPAFQQLNAFMDQVRLVKRKDINAWLDANGYGELKNQNYGAAEWLTHAASKDSPKWHDRYVAAVVEFFRKLGKAVGWDFKMTEAEIRNWNRKVEGMIGQETGLRGQNPMTLEQRTYQGSPTRGIERMDDAYLGTGEGRRSETNNDYSGAYGWGHYSAQSKKTGEWYRQTLSGEGKITVNGEEGKLPSSFKSAVKKGNLTNKQLNQFASTVFKDFRNFSEGEGDRTASNLIAAARSWYGEFPLSVEDQLYDFAHELTGDSVKEVRGQLYQLEVPDSDKLLDWDKPLSEQPAGVREKLEKAGLRAKEKKVYLSPEMDSKAELLDMIEDDADYVKPDGSLKDGLELRKGEDGKWAVFYEDTGDGIYMALARKLNSAKAASQYLDSIGIPGHQYLDGSSRSQGDGSRNVVTYSDKNVDITGTFYRKATFSDPSAEAAYQEGQKGIGDQRGLASRLKDKWGTLYSGMTRHFTHLPMTKEFSKAHEILRQLEQAPNASQKTAIDWLQKMVGDLNLAEFDLFNRKVFLDDMGHDIQMGRVLPNGFTPAGHAVDLADVNAKVAATPKVKKALADRKVIHDELAKRLVAHGILDQDQLNNPSYFRHEVLKYAREWQNTQGSGKRLNKPMPGYAKGREGSSEMYSTHFLEVEFAYMHRALVDIATEGSIGKIKAAYDKKAEAKADAKKWNDAALVARGRRPAHIKEADKRQILGKTYRTWRDYIPDGYTTFQPSKGLLYLTGNSISDAAVQELLDAQQGNTPADRAVLEALDGVREAMQIAGKKPELVLPEPLAKQLEALKPQRVPSFFDEALSDAVGKWKQWQLFNPRRWLKYNVNNMSGDMDGVFAAIKVSEYGKFFSNFVPAAKELYAVAKGKADPSDMYNKARWAGVIDSGLTVGEIPDISGLGEFESLVAKETGRGALLKPLRAYWRAAQGSSEFRESLMRYTAFRYYMAELGKGRTVAQLGYGASYQPLVDGLDTNEAKAALLSRDLLVDYGAISAYGTQLRNRVFPFYSWMEGNLKRYNRIFANAVKEGPVEGFKAGGIIGASLGARFTAYAAIRASMIYAMVALWNNLMWPDEERELETSDRLQLHVIVGRDDKGNIQTIRLQGALSDYLGWAGFPDVVSVLMKAQDGKASYGDILKTMAKAPLNRLINSLTPIIKMPIELASGYSLYPDSTTPRKITDRTREAAKTFSLDNELDAFRHWKDGTPVKDSYWGSWKKALVYESSVGETNYAAMRDRIKDFKESKGIETAGWSTSPKAELSKQYRLATKWGDTEAADKLRERMITELGIPAREVDKTIKENLLRAAPLAGIPQKERDEFLDSLSERDHERLAQATKWYKETYLEGSGLEKDFYLKEVGGDARQDRAQFKEMYKSGDKEGAKAFAKEEDLNARYGLSHAMSAQMSRISHYSKLVEESRMSPDKKAALLDKLDKQEEKVKTLFMQKLQNKGVQPRM